MTPIRSAVRVLGANTLRLALSAGMTCVFLASPAIAQNAQRGAELSKP
ncbi:MAG: hypothetical protein ACK52M_20005 [bacterium]